MILHRLTYVGSVEPHLILSTLLEDYLSPPIEKKWAGVESNQPSEHFQCPAMAT